MLVLSRRIGEQVVIGDGACVIRVTVLSSKGSQVRLGLEAPDEVAIRRQELCFEIALRTQSSACLRGAPIPARRP